MDNFQEILIRFVELASGAYEAFKGSKAHDKNKLIKLVFSNLKLNGAKLEFKLAPPFDGFVKYKEIGEWWALVDDFRHIRELRILILSQCTDEVIT